MPELNMEASFRESDEIEQTDGYTEIIDHHSNPNQRKLSYEYALWAVFLACMVWAVIDRFTVNVWSMGINRAFPTKAVWTVKVYQVVAWVSGRISLVTTSLLFLTQCRVTMNIIANHSPSCIQFGDIHYINNKIHSFAGWLTGIIILMHVWLIFLPYVLQGVQLKFLEKQSMRSTFPFYSQEKRLLTLAPDDIWRLVEMTLLFFLVFPLSMLNFIKVTRFRLALVLHIFGAIMFAVDIIRKKSHPHSKVFNLPVVLYWLADRIVGIMYYRTGLITLTGHKILDDGAYIVLYMKLDYLNFQKRIEGEHVYLQLPYKIGSLNRESLVPSSAHPFTIWHKRQIHTYLNSDKIQFNKRFGGSITEYIWRRQDTGTNTSSGNNVNDVASLQTIVPDSEIGYSAANDDLQYDVACIIKTIRQEDNQKEKCSLKSDETTWTEKLYKKIASNEKLNTEKNQKLIGFGPYNSIFHSIKKSPKDLPGILIIGSGAGAAPLIDFYHFLVHNKIKLEKPAALLYTCNSPQLFEFVCSIIMGQHIDKYSCKGWITNSKSDSVVHSYANSSKETTLSRLKSRDIADVNVRIPIEDEINRCKNLGVTEVFYCGNPNFRQCVKRIAKNLGLEFKASSF